MNRKISYVLLAATILFAACKGKYKHAEDGIEYKVISKETGAKAVKGNFLELNIVAVYNDSTLYSTREMAMPQYAPYDPEQFPPAYKKIFGTLYAGDSVVIRVSTDTLIKQGHAEPFMKKGQYVYQYFTVSNIFTTDAQKDSAQKTHVAAAKAIASQKILDKINKQLVADAGQIKLDDAVLVDYMAKKNIKATKGTWGTYVAITDAGTGTAIDNNTVAMVNYTGKTLVDTVFDSNTDIKFKHVQPFPVDIAQVNVIPGWIDGLKGLKKGAKATFLIPSSLAYGKTGSGPKIAPNTNLIFNVEIVDVVSAEQYHTEQMMKQQIERMKQQQMMDSMRKAQPQHGQGGQQGQQQGQQQGGGQPIE